MSEKIEEVRVERTDKQITQRVVAAVDLNGPNAISHTRRFFAWVLMNVPLGFLAPWVAGYVFTGRWHPGERVR